jgi:uncharacterized sulfatase
MVKNVLLIVIDALRADRVHEDNNLTPVIDSLADTGETFTSCYACADVTTGSIPTIQTGLYPTRHGLLHFYTSLDEKEIANFSATTTIQEYLNPTHETIVSDINADIYRRGFDTCIPSDSDHIQFSKDILKYLPDNVYNSLGSLYRKLNPFRSPINRTGRHKLGEGRLDKNRAGWKTDRFISEIESTDGPWFGFMHYWDTHMEYSAESSHRETVSDKRYTDGDIKIEDLKQKHPEISDIDRPLWKFTDVDTVGDIKRRYDASVRCVDDYIGKIVTNLQERNETDDTLIIITSDHGESLTENGVLFAHRELYDQTWHTPLIINGPQFNGKEDRFVQHFDIAPTILDVLNMDFDPVCFDGQSLSPNTDGTRSLNRDAVFAEQIHHSRRQAIRTDHEYKYIRNLREERPGTWSELQRPDEELYNIKNDPEEKNNLAPVESDLCDKLNARIDDWLESVPEPGVSEPSTQSSNHKLEQQFKSLGYK